MSDMGKLQDGIYFATRTPGFFAFLLLNIAAGKTTAEVDRLLQKLWEMYDELKQGKVRDLGQSATVPAGELHVLLGYGRAAFERDGPAETYLPAPMRNACFRPPVAGAPIAVAPDASYGAGLLNAGIQYAPGVTANPGDAAFGLQFTATTPLAVERAVVETWKALCDEGPGVALDMTAVYTGSQRDDRRSWIDFHDGVSNLSPEERTWVIPVGNDATDAWTVGGTYMAFVRLGIDLAVWRRLTPSQQESLVGRAKLSGSALVGLDPLTSANGCPLDGSVGTFPAKEFREPAPTTDATLKVSHVQRANHHKLSPADPFSFRIFRQGYPFLESTSTPPGFRTGLNFVSFQNNPWRFLRMLMGDGWLGRTNFAGANGAQAADPLTAAYAAGLFVVPPRSEDGSFPGRGVLNEDFALAAE